MKGVQPPSYSRPTHSLPLLAAPSAGPVRGPLFRASFQCADFEEHQKVHFDLSCVLGHGGMAHVSPDNGGYPDPFCTVPTSGGPQFNFRRGMRMNSLRFAKARGASVSSGLGSTPQDNTFVKIPSTPALPVSRTTEGPLISAGSSHFGPGDSEM